MKAYRLKLIRLQQTAIAAGDSLFNLKCRVWSGKGPRRIPEFTRQRARTAALPLPQTIERRAFCSKRIGIVECEVGLNGAERNERPGNQLRLFDLKYSS